MGNFDKVNVILLTGNLVLWVALFFLSVRKRRTATGMAETAHAAALAQSITGTFAEIPAGFLEFAVYGAGMIRMADLIMQGIAAPGGENRALLAVRVLLVESMVLLLPLFRMSYRWKIEENGIKVCGECLSAGSMYSRNLSAGELGGADHPSWNPPDSMGFEEGPVAGFRQSLKSIMLEEGEGILGMLLLLGLTLQGWQEQETVRAFGRQIWVLVMFFCYGYLKRWRRLHNLAERYGEGSASIMEELWIQGFGGNSMVSPDGNGGRGVVSPDGNGESGVVSPDGNGGRGVVSPDGNGGRGVVSLDGYNRSGMGIWTEGYGRNAIDPPMQGRGRKNGRGMLGNPAANADHARQMEYLRNVEEQYQRTRELWHDLKNHIKVLEILAQEERFGELTDYLDSFRRDVERRMVSARTGCAPVDALLGDKLYLAGRQGTELSLELCRLSQTGIEAVDFCVILGNLLDNALEACARLDGKGRIGLRMRREEDFYYITVVNTSEEPLRDGKSYVSEKPGRDNGVGHGLGLRSAERLAHRYGGLLATDYSDGEFRVVVRLQDASRG